MTTREPADENLAVLLTPAGSGAIAVVRIVGAAVCAWLSKRFSGAPRVGRCAYGELSDENARVLDDVVVVLIRDGAADLNVHGGPWVIESVLQLLDRDGFELLKEMPLEALDGDEPI